MNLNMYRKNTQDASENKNKIRNKRTTENRMKREWKNKTHK